MHNTVSDLARGNVQSAYQGLLYRRIEPTLRREETANTKHSQYERKVHIGDETLYMSQFSDSSRLAEIHRSLGKPKRPHTCAPGCIPEGTPFPEKNPYTVPVQFGFQRVAYTVSSSHTCQMCTHLNGGTCPRVHILYVTPCGKMLLTPKHVQSYLVTTASATVTVDMFTFSYFFTLSHAHVKVRDYELDVSGGKERTAISLFNSNSEQSKPKFKYMIRRLAHDELDLDLKRLALFRSCCDCTDNCQSEECACRRLTVTENCGLPGYQFRRLYKKHSNGIFECNDDCTCNRTCPNRLVGNGITVSLQMFHAGTTGWGLRAEHFIARGQYICSYNGRIIDSPLLMRNKSDFKDMYAADLDYIESCVNSDDLENLGRKDLFGSQGQMLSVDGSTEASIARFFNHGCSPNLFNQSVFLETHDIRLNHMALFALRDIQPFEELVWNYQYKMGSDSERVIYCECNCLKCKGRLL